MSSPDRMEMLATAVGNLVQAMRLMDAEQQSHDERMRAYEAQLRESDARLREHEARQRAFDERMREFDAQSRENRARIGEIIGLLTEMQADIARLDAAS